MKELPNPATEVVLLYLQKLETLSEKERDVLIRAIELISNPIFITGENL